MSSLVTPAVGVALTEESGWLLREEGFDPTREHDVESLFTIGNGYLGTRGSVIETNSVSHPATFIAGVFDPPSGGDAIPELVVAPDWLSVRIYIEGEPLEMSHGRLLGHRRTLDMRQGALRREWRHRDQAGRITRIVTLQFASFDDRHAVALQVLVIPENYSGRVRLEAAIDGRVTNAGGVRHLAPVQSRPLPLRGVLYATYTLKSGITVALAQMSELQGCGHDRAPHPEYVTSADEFQAVESWEFEAEIGREYCLNKYVSIFTSRDGSEPTAAAANHVRSLAEIGFSELFRRHAAALAARWETAAVDIEGAEQDCRAVRFAIYHLLIAANPEDERVSIGARTLSGESYKGHVFWDTETFMLPFFTFTDPPAARALLKYRYHTIEGARKKAAKAGYRGALYSWESAESGEETTPPFVINPEGLVVPVLSGIEQHHISADIAYAIWQYWEATGDESFLLEGGAEIVLDTARFWASRAALEADNRYHIRHIMGPDEYHESIDDSVYSNVMARWTLRFGLRLNEWLAREHPAAHRALAGRLGLDEAELRHWVAVADNIFINYHEAERLFEEFTGYFQLEYVHLPDYEPRTAPMDVLLGRPRTQASQVVKQADVILLFHLLPHDFDHEVKQSNFEYYEPRTGHGSSLSPSIHAIVAARLGDRPTAERYFKQAAEIDLQNNMGNAAGGIHAAACGGLWQAVVFGFGGFWPEASGLTFDPLLPGDWSALRFTVIWQGRVVRVQITAAPLALELAVEGGGGSVPVRLARGEWQTATPGRPCRWVMENGGWRVQN